MEWRLDNSSYTANLFDVIASATFVHAASGEIRTIPLFYVGGTEWHFRFSATRTGSWSVSTASGDPELDGRQGTITIGPNPNPAITGFLTSSGNKFARQVGENGELKAFIYNGYQDNAGFGIAVGYAVPEGEQYLLILIGGSLAVVSALLLGTGWLIWKRMGK